MSSLRSILNPEDHHRSALRRPPQGSPLVSSDPSSPASGSSVASPRSNGESSRAFTNKEQDGPYRDSEHEPHPHCPDTLDCLPDTDGRPQHTLPVILRCAILGSPRQRLTIREIYAAMEQKYLYFRTAGPTWKQSVRHHLSLNRLFERQPRPVTDPGFGSYWTVNLSAPPGTKRPRKRGRPNKGKENGATSSPPKKRGRPRKTVETSNDMETDPPEGSQPPSELKSAAQEVLSLQSETDPKASAIDSDPEPTTSDDYESEEDMAVPPSHLSSTSGVRMFGLNPVVHPLASPLPRISTTNPYPVTRGPDDSTIERLQIEMSGLRRQLSDAIAVSLRISDQLAEAQAEATRVKANLRTVEAMLEDEGRKRKEAERIVDEESRLRRQVEEALLELRQQRRGTSFDSDT
ncbi:hypothetical protein CONPUDRAFT_134291 [Coniophora puteana RWD-64-598 SS2]|uniref:Fork-head domain-containing protein n=1 Tax=Coniophora puteana (strain RWD-64-598) TaxID=741705 RepID=A0A5M3N6P8_CONPW|nr:uncharacterized protein CONPUDRAFT_134291 [Coniophora puteana RWD-64-598 SS2]EIW86958.1 hypothetical protein CONPUDRAFT_134291 [Coniophora puteana RWD-64-598 SS2]